MDADLDAIFGREEEEHLLTPDALEQSAQQPTRLHLEDGQQLHRRHFLQALAAGSLALPFLHAQEAEAGEAKVRKVNEVAFRGHKYQDLAHIRNMTPKEIITDAVTAIPDTYTGGPFMKWYNQYRDVVEGKDVDTWNKWVKDEGQKPGDTRSFPAEYTAYGNTFTMRPVDGVPPEGVHTTKGYDVYAFSPDTFVSSGKQLPDKYRDRRYLMVRLHVPAEQNPYGVALSKYCGDATTEQIKAAVEWYRKNT